MPTEAYLILGALLFALGAAGVVTRTSALSVLIAVELMLNAVNLTFVAAARRTRSWTARWPRSSSSRSRPPRSPWARHRHRPRAAKVSVDVDDASDLRG
jgi:multisubunit Na+/H+ antiporter MnhC subunit